MAGQPDKVCDQIAEAIVDEYLRRDPHARIDIKVVGSHGMLMVAGEVSSSADFDISALAKKVYQDIGYPDDIEIFVNIETQSEEIKHIKTGTLDTVVVNGYSTRETREHLPRAVVFTHEIVRRLDEIRKSDPTFFWMKPDGKVQVVMQKDKVKSITVLASHQMSIDVKDVKTILLERIIIPAIGEESAQIYINPAGPFTISGFRADSGSSGQKSCVDTYGGLIPHGDKSFVGKDPFRSERAGAYIARMAANFLVDKGVADSAMVQIVYTMNRAEPIYIEAIGNRQEGLGNRQEARVGKTDLTQIIKQKFDFRPEAVVERLQLRGPIYQQTAVYGCFGRAELPWEDKTT